MSTLVESKSWQTRRARLMMASTLPDLPEALCRDYPDPDLWHPSRPNRRQEMKAVLICANCPVITKCFRYSIRMHPMSGIWGGATEEMRAFTISEQIEVL